MDVLLEALGQYGLPGAIAAAAIWALVHVTRRYLDSLERRDTAHIEAWKGVTSALTACTGEVAEVATTLSVHEANAGRRQAEILGELRGYAPRPSPR